MKEVKIIDKPAKGRYEDWDVHKKSSKVSVFNLYDQGWTDLEQQGMTHLFNDQAEFERKKTDYLKGGDNK